MDKNRKFSFKAVFVGFLVTIIGSLIVVTLFGSVAAIILAVKCNSEEQVLRILDRSIFYDISISIIVAFFTILGGYITASIAKFSELKHSFAMGVVYLISGLLLFNLLKYECEYSDLIEGVLVIPFVLLGAYIKVSGMYSRNLVYLNLIPVVIIHLLILPFWFMGDTIFKTNVTGIETVVDLIILPLLLFIINIIYTIRNKRYLFIMQIVLMVIGAFIGNYMHYFKWGVASGQLFSPDIKTVELLWLFTKINTVSIVVIGLLVQIVLLVIKNISKDRA